MAKEWKIVAVWADESGAEVEEVVELDEYAEATKTLHSLRQCLGERGPNGKILFSLRIDGDRRRAFAEGRW